MVYPTGGEESPDGKVGIILGLATVLIPELILITRPFVNSLSFLNSLQSHNQTIYSYIIYKLQ